MNYKSQSNYKTGGCVKTCRCIDKACELKWAKEDVRKSRTTEEEYKQEEK